ncbi:hypothetical protein GOP47_0021460 [Adiantum capillus-veneris]|uniref:Uncharacterized protein n=1 Tax=Adiantum capillus-veneris TaxID=13818 RepID=A0A9D4U8F2_ADICA|nr:hypothetical protein GOP47_0021460 [Adiantum capillus-veneris]
MFFPAALEIDLWHYIERSSSKRELRSGDADLNFHRLCKQRTLQMISTNECRTFGRTLKFCIERLRSSISTRV